MSRRRVRGKVLSRDTVSLVGGWYLMIYQGQFAATFNATVFFGGMIAAGIPGALQVFGLWFGARTPLELPPSPEPASSADSST